LTIKDFYWTWVTVTGVTASPAGLQTKSIMCLMRRILGKLLVFPPVPEIRCNAQKTNLETLYAAPKYAPGNSIMHVRQKIVPLMGKLVQTSQQFASEFSVGFVLVMSIKVLVT
jgi:hypothetical protein